MGDMITRRTSLLLSAAALIAPSALRAQSALPEKTLRILVGFPAGGGTDVMARLIAEPLKQRTGRNIIIENKVGASGTIAGATLKASEPDGSTICFMPSATVTQKLTMISIPFDPEIDMVPITLAGTLQTAFCVSPTIGVNTFAEYIEWLKKNSARAQFGTTAIGSFTHFFGVMTGQAISQKLDPIPYRGAAPLVADLQAGHITAGCGSITDFIDHHRQGSVKILLTSGSKPHVSMPDLPTGISLGYPSLTIMGWYAFFSPAKTPPALIEAWGKDLRAVLKLPEVEKRLTELGMEVETSTSEQFSQRMSTDLKRWKEIIDAIGYKPT
jgi:tripartite-type tricarboxylate transporter receptor subunit TctC